MPSAIPSTLEAAPNAAQHSELQLVAALKRRDDAAYARLVSDNKRRLLAVAVRMLGNMDDAMDVVQDAFLAAFIAIPNFRGTARLSTWLHRITVNCALQVLRNRRRDRERILETGEPAQLDAVPDTRGLDPERRLLKKHEAGLLCHRLQAISKAHREVFVMRHLLELSTEETARRLGTSANAVKIRLHRAGRALRALARPEALALDSAGGAS